jgi:hypothetical protein
MNVVQIKKRLTNGFRPFVLHLSDGRKFRVPHPGFIMVGRRVVVVLRDDDVVEILDPLHIVSLEEGSTRRR